MAEKPRESPRNPKDIDTDFRRLKPTEPRLNKPITGVPSTPESEAIHEYGRLLKQNFFGELDDDELEEQAEELEIESEEQREAAEKVSVIYKYLEYQNRRDYKGIIRIHHDPYINKTYFGRWPISPEAHVRTLKGYFKLFPDATTEANKIIAVQGNTVVVRTTARGTQAESFPGSMLGHEGKQVAVTLIHAIEVIDGQIASCESTSPFENQWEAGHVNSNFPGLGGDISEVRARQGVNADIEYLTERLIGDTTIEEMHAGSDPQIRAKIFDDENTLEMIRQLIQMAPNQCQSLIAPEMRRCTKLAVEDSLYCMYHQEHGYGID